LSSVGYDDAAVTTFLDAAAGKVSADRAVEAFTDARNSLERAMEVEYEAIAPVVFYIGSTGLIPDEFGGPKAMSADDARAAFPDLSIGKGESDGMFYDVGGVLVSVYPKAEYFSTKGPVADAE